MIATGKITAVAVEAETEQPVRVPGELREAVAAFEGSPVYIEVEKKGVAK